VNYPPYLRRKIFYGGKRMTPKAKFVFTRIEGTATRYALSEHTGIEIPRFPAVWTEGPRAGQKYIGLRDTCDRRIIYSCRKYGDLTLELEKARMVTAFSLSERYPTKAYGDFAGGALLIEIPQDKSTITLYFYPGMKPMRQALFREWAAGKLDMSVKIPIMIKERKGIDPESVRSGSVI
jgi:hypothetical protein